MLISGSTKVFALFGDPVTHSLSPIMQNAAFKALQLDCCYVPFLVREGSLAAAVKAVRELNLGGVNITIPHKEKVLAYLDQVDEGALQIGAVNTIVNRDGYLFGYNTDASGFLASLRSVGFEPNGKRVVVMGAGGAARAAAVALVHEGNRCQANEIMVTSDSFGATQPDEVDAKQSMNLSPTPANSCTETCCKTFVPHEGDIHLDNIERMTQ
jgi:shikimate dehydrogenase